MRARTVYVVDVFVYQLLVVVISRAGRMRGRAVSAARRDD